MMDHCCDDFKHKDSGGHVHFQQVDDTHSLIQVWADGGNIVHVHVGFLQTDHKYEIQFDIPNLLGQNASAVNGKLPKDVDLSVVGIQPTDSSNTKLHVLIHMFLVKEGLMKECFTLQDDDNKQLDIIVHARVLGKHSGTPMLKDGIHRLEVVKDTSKESLSDNELIT